LRGAFKLANTVFNARMAYTGSPRGDLPSFDAARLGGFLNMTAFSADQLLGDEMRYVGLRTEHILGQLPLGLRGDMRIGFAAEAARLGRRYSETGRDDWIDSLAVYLGGETPLGPAYLGYGRSSRGVSSLFLFIGTP
jgi:NTE family protein